MDPSLSDPAPRKMEQAARLGRLLRERREELGLYQYNLDGPSTWLTQKVERGTVGRRALHPDTWSKFEKALKLVPGSLMRTYHGGPLRRLEDANGEASPLVPESGLLITPGCKPQLLHRRLVELGLRLSNLVALAEAEGNDQLLLAARGARDLGTEITATVDDIKADFHEGKQHI